MTQTTKKETTLRLAAKLAAIGKEIGAVDKSGRNSQQNYAYIEYGVVAGRIRELFDKYHVTIIPNVESVQVDEIANKYGNKGYHYVLTMTFVILDGDNPEEREVASWTGEASDFGDKGINKAETAGTKYFLMRLFNISEKGEEDADSTTPTMVTAQKRKPIIDFPEQARAEAKLKLSMCASMAELKNTYTGLGAVAQDPRIVEFKDRLKAKFEAQENAG